ncbi:phage major capsid protein [Bacillus sp. IS1]|uniref:phage major capsid protein n=1 Tax=Bacillus TaxID=1386 RepID=UPI0015605C3A|nr:MULTISPECIES: phage major capsid protein [Bacillus]MCY9463984.1 phage major capsid protein [Bacillus velezensis]MDU0076521.1 phage major capsid protein [Bacillus sp. IG2]MDU0101235.1 phage major capsid protein [Bacillus sp. IS1]MEC2269337.1 phage major capsid protein [Bacillus velezensis]MEC3794571.1 phage major capsid protein [Bacillus velezensis]
MPMQMSKKEIALRQQFTEKKQQADKALQEGNTDEARALLDEVKQLKNQIELMTEGRSLDVPDLPGGVNFVPEQERNPEGRSVSEQEKEERQQRYRKAFFKGLRGKRLTEEEREILDRPEFRAMSGKNEEDGGILIPEDIGRQINELKRQYEPLEQYVTVEPVTSRSGTRLLEKNVDMVPFSPVEELDELPEIDQPKFSKLAYSIVDYGGIMTLSNTMQNDSDQNIMMHVAKWFAKKSVVTRNSLILAALASLKKVDIDGVDGIKKALNVTLDPMVSPGSIVMTNQDGFNWFDTLKDGTGKYLLQPDPTNPTKKLLDGRPVVPISNRVLKTQKGKAPVIIGNLKEAIVLFDREQQSIASTDTGAGAFETNTTKVRGIEREDVRKWDEDAVVFGQITVE